MKYDSEHLFAYRTTIDEFAIIAKTDRHGRIVAVNDRFCEISQYSRDELIGQTHSILNSGLHPKSFFTDMWQTLASGATWRGEIRNRAKDGSFYWVLTTIVSEKDEADRVTGYIAIRVDITDLRKAEASLDEEFRRRQDAEALLRDIIEAMPIGVAAYDQNDRLLLSNSAYRNAVPGSVYRDKEGGTFEDIIRGAVANGALNIPAVASPEEREMAIQTTLKRHQTCGQASTHKLADGRWIQAQGSRTPKGDSVEVVTDISAIKRAEKSMREQIKYDPLTGIFNRTGFAIQLKRALDDYAASDSRFALAMVDIDHFKRVNDRMGHAAGDAVLRGFAQRLERLPGIRCAARLGGDEFAVLIDLPEGNLDGLSEFVERAAATCFRPLSVRRKRIDVSGSVGVALFPADGSDGELLLQAADMALMTAKRLGRSRVQFVNAAIKVQHIRRRIIIDTLSAAIERREIKPAFQPLVSSKAHALKGMEVLARWNHAEIGPVSPGEFIPIAQEIGLLSDLDHMITASACELAGPWLSSGLIEFLSLNASPTELVQRGYSTAFLTTLRRAGVRPNQVCIEILETSFIDDVPAVMRNLTRLSEAGVRISLDDFGSGFSNLQAAMGLPLSGIKFDRSIIQRLSEEGMLQATITSMAKLFHSFGLYTVAEGIETEIHLNMAEKMGANYLQGFLFGEALLFAEADPFVRSHTALAAKPKGRLSA